MSIKKKASAHWEGDLKTGKGALSTPQSGLLDKTRYAFSSRFGDEKGTNPEELIAAAHAGCFTMALSGKLGEAGMTAKSLNTKATVSLEKQGAAFTITAVHLELVAEIPGADQAAFDAAVKDAKENCPVSKLLNATITLDSRLNA